VMGTLASPTAPSSTTLALATPMPMVQRPS
jgi:hypothetical protein